MEAERSADVEAQPLARDDLALTHAYWRAANYLSVGQVYLLDNPLLKTPLTLDHVKPRLLGPLAAYLKQQMRDKLIEHKTYITTYGEDMPDIHDWKWSH